MLAGGEGQRRQETKYIGPDAWGGGEGEGGYICELFDTL
jgi:hypothetical protein